MKIVYCTDSVNHLGGIQRVTTVKASALAAIAGNEVYIVTAEGRGKSIFPLDSRVKTIDLDVRYYDDGWKSKWHLIRSTITKRREHKKKLRKLLGALAPDVVISTGTSEKFFLPAIAPKGSTVIREIHSCTRYRLLHARGWFDTLAAHAGDFLDFKINMKRYDRVYLLTEEDRQGWKNREKVSVMPNPNSFVPDQSTSGKAKKVIAVGRYTRPKRFDRLLSIWHQVAARFPDWSLEIWGEGEEREKLEKQIEQLGLKETAFLKGYTSDIQKQLSNASVFALTSDFEGFGLVIIESMSHGVVPVSFACPTGPKDIITDGEDGFLVPVDNPDLFAGKLALLMDNEDIRIRMAHKAVQRADDFTPERIARRWINEFESLRPTAKD